MKKEYYPKVCDLGNRDIWSGREASEYVDYAYDGMPGSPIVDNSVFTRLYGVLPDGTWEEVSEYTWEKIGDPKFYIRNAVRQIEEERGV